MNYPQIPLPGGAPKVAHKPSPDDDYCKPDDIPAPLLYTTHSAQAALLCRADILSYVAEIFYVLHFTHEHVKLPGLVYKFNPKLGGAPLCGELEPDLSGEVHWGAELLYAQWSVECAAEHLLQRNVREIKWLKNPLLPDAFDKYWLKAFFNRPTPHGMATLAKAKYCH